MTLSAALTIAYGGIIIVILSFHLFASDDHLKYEHATATIGGTEVPADLDCEEDEVIGFIGVPDLLVCVHYESELLR